MIEFEGVVPALGHALAKRGYTELTPVQKAVLAPELEKADALVSAQTGSGKTVAFGLAMAPTLLDGAERLGGASAPLALVVAPTRELALQVKREFDWLYEAAGAAIVSCVGGMDARSERRALERGAHIVVGTPGRLCDHIRRGGLDTSRLKAVVLDEADEMLDLGFREDLEFILETTPEERRTLLFSATVPAPIAKLARQYQRDAVRVTTSEEKQQHVDIEYRALMVLAHERENAIVNVLRYYDAENVLVFCNTRASVNHMVARFNNRGFSVVALSGELSQTERTHALQALRDGRARVCVATDVAARGIDLAKLDLVIHAELPGNPETLLHRSGRTGRAGRKGISALIVDKKSRARAERLLRAAKIGAVWTTPPSADDVNRRDEERMLESPYLAEPVSDEERAFVERLLRAYTPEQAAAAFVRLSRCGQSAPEEIGDAGFDAAKPDGQERRADMRAPRKMREARVEFEDSAWIALSVGRKQNAEPRWLIPMICNAAGITKREIGTIAIEAEETFVQLNGEHADDFFAALGKNKTMERNIRVKRLDGAPERRALSCGEKSGRRKEGKIRSTERLAQDLEFLPAPFSGREEKQTAKTNDRSKKKAAPWKKKAKAGALPPQKPAKPKRKKN